MSDPATHAQRTERYNLNALYETSRLLSASLDLGFVLNNLLLTAMSKLLVTRGAVWLYEPAEEAYRLAAKKGLSATGDGLFRLNGGGHDGGLRYGADVPEALREMAVELAIPIGFGEREIGLMGLGKKATGQPYEERELEFIRSLVHMSASAVHNSLMVEELRQANRDLDAKIQELNTLFDLSQSFNASIERSQIVKLLSFALMGQMLVGKHLFLMRRTEAAGEGEPVFETVTSKGLTHAEIEPDLFEALCRLSDPVLLEEADRETHLKWALFKQRGLVLALPLRQKGETCGVLCLGAKMTGQPYSEGDVEFLYALGNLALVSLQNSHLVESQIEKERLEEEMRLASQIQKGLLPQKIPTLPGIEVAAFNRPSREVGGDYFDVIRLGDGRLLTMVADVTGKGVPASLLMANLQACLRVMLPMDLSLEEVTAHMNRVICENTAFDKFITSFAGVVDVRAGTYRYVNAGHNPPMHVRAGGAVELLEKGGLLLGVMKNMPYELGTATLEAGDVLVLFTDGVTEAMSPDEEEYGERRLEALVLDHGDASAQAILDAIYADIRHFTHDPASLSDDLTMIVIKVAALESESG